jgi:hypothetical protein
LSYFVFSIVFLIHYFSDLSVFFFSFSCYTEILKLQISLTGLLSKYKNVEAPKLFILVDFFYSIFFLFKSCVSLFLATMKENKRVGGLNFILLATSSCQSI